MALRCLIAASALFTAGLAAQPNATSWQILNEGLKSAKPQTRSLAIAAIGSVGLVPEAVKLVESGLPDKEADVRQVAAAQLGLMKSKQSIPALQAALDDPSNAVAFAAAQSLWALGDRTSRTVLQAIFVGERKSGAGFVEGTMHDANKTMHDPKKLAKIGAKEVSGALLGPFSLGLTAAEEMLKDGGAPARTAAATLLAQDCDAHSRELLESSLERDKNWAVKAAIARALGGCGSKDSIPWLERYLSDNHDALRLMAAAAIVRLDPLAAPSPQ